MSTLCRWTMRERGGRFESSSWTCLLALLIGVLQSCLAISTTAAHDALPHASNTPGGGLESVNANADHVAQELRRTIEESVLNRLASSIMEHGERVESGERRARPFVTLTYAQSIDGSISAADKSQVRERLIPPTAVANLRQFRRSSQAVFWWALEQKAVQSPFLALPWYLGTYVRIRLTTYCTLSCIRVCFSDE